MSPQSPQLPWKVRLQIFILTLVYNIIQRKDGSINRRLMNLLDVKASPSPNKPIHGVRTTDITVDKSRNLWFRLYIPDVPGVDDKARLPVVFYFHGGGFALMSPSSTIFNNASSELAGELNAVIISVNYRLAPEHRHPCQIEDCFDVVNVIDRSEVEALSSVNINLEHCFVAGDSAGANLAHQLVLKADEHEFANIKLIGVVSIQPFFGGEERTESERKLVNVPLVTTERTDLMWRLFLPEGSNRDHRVSNVFGPNSSDISGVKYPATIVFVGGFDPLQDWQKRYYEGLKRNGKEAYLVVYPNTIHSFQGFPDLPEYSLYIKEVKGFMQNQINRQKK